MDGKKLFRILTAALAAAAAALLVSVYGANKLLTARSGDLVDLKAKSAATKQQEADLGKAKQDIVKYGELNEIARSVVPQDKDQVKTVSEIASLAAQSGIPRLSSVTFPPSTLGGTKQVKTPHGLTQVTPVKGMAGVYVLQITITQGDKDAVPYNDFLTFLSKLERNRRTAQVSSITVQPNAEQPDKVSFTLVIDEYIKP